MGKNIFYNDEDARQYISLMFDGYEKRKEENRLYNYDGIPEIIIRTYYSYVNKPEFDQIVYNFKRRYIYNENKMEGVHSKSEINGLGAVYDYILKKEDLENISIYDLSYIHEELYSKTPHPEFGGRYRNQEIYLLGGNENNISNGSVELCPYWNITHEVNLLKPEVDKLVKEGLMLGNSPFPDQLINYIDKCIELKCKLIKIHPFRDGNGRAVRAFMNLLFRLANIPPVYVENKEKVKYQEAMNKALTIGDYESIKVFYHYKICDSIMALDVRINDNINENKEDTNIKGRTK